MNPAGTLATLYSFCSLVNCADGWAPDGALIQASDGNFYRVTEFGGSSVNCPYVGGCGTLFRITPKGSIATLYNFCAQANCADGFYPLTSLVQGADGNLYGTT